MWQKLMWFSNCHTAAVARGEKPHHEHNGSYPHSAQVADRYENLFLTTYTSNSPGKYTALVSLWITTYLSPWFLQKSSWPQVTLMKSWILIPTSNCFTEQASWSHEIEASSTYSFSSTTTMHELIPPSSLACCVLPLCLSCTCSLRKIFFMHEEVVLSHP